MCETTKTSRDYQARELRESWNATYDRQHILYPFTLKKTYNCRHMFQLSSRRMAFRFDAGRSGVSDEINHFMVHLFTGCFPGDCLTKKRLRRRVQLRF